MVIQASRNLVFVAFTLVALACEGGKNKSDHRSKDDAATEQEEVEDPSGGGDDTGAGPQQPLSLGLPNFCSFTAATGCFRCTPRELPLQKCAKDLSATFDPAKECQHDDVTFTCGTFTFNFGEKGQMERLYEQIPLLVAGAQVLLSQGMADEPETYEVVKKALDLIIKHRLAIFTGDGIDAPAKDLVQLIKETRPDLSQEVLTEVETKVTSALTATLEKYKGGSLSENDILLLLLSFVSQVPGIQEIFSSDLDINVLLAALMAKDDPQAAAKVLEGLSSVLGNLGGLDEGSDDAGGGDDDGEDESTP